ncbi:MAG: hypothetical protein H7321_01180 [Bacteroidia bacterium]|nr:hypothetical protein [Bacteroidia bacterium]
MKKLFFLSLILATGFNAFCQDNYYPVGSPVYHWLDRNDISKNYFQKNVPSINQAGRISSAKNIEFVCLTGISDSLKPQFLNSLNKPSYFRIENLDDSLLSKRKLGNIYKYPAAFYAIKGDDYTIVVNPVIGFNVGYDAKDPKRKLFQNSRGAEIRGNIGGSKGVGFYSYFTDNQIRLPAFTGYYTDSLGVTPNELFWKKFKKTGSDFFQARGYVTFSAAKYIHFQFGHDKNFIGSGYRSLILSDFSPQYLFFKINTSIGKFNYQNLFTQFTDYSTITGNTLFNKKYGAFHRLGINVTRNLNIGLNEMIIFDRQQDSTGKSTGYDLNYLNPVIFYRAVESNLGSRDNAMVALDFKWIFLRKFSLYGQFVLDEFVLKQIKNDPDWWGNKYGYQLGMKYINVADIKNFDLQVEYNRVRPYTYSHYRTSQSYSNFNQALAHPLGSNFSEWTGILKYQVKEKIFLNLTQIYALKGSDYAVNGLNYGSNILRNYDTRQSSQAPFLQGNKQQLMITSFTASYMLKHNLFIDANILYRNLTNSNLAPNTFVIGGGVRLNIPERKINY